MSAHQVSPDMIDLIVSASLEHWGEPHITGITVYIPDLSGLVVHNQELAMRIEGATNHEAKIVLDGGPYDRQLLGEELIAANITSLAARYKDCHTDRLGGLVGYLPQDYKYKTIMRGKFADIVHAIGAIASYRYQTCEALDEERSFWGRFCQTAEHNLVLAVDGVEDGWSWSREWQEEQHDKIRADIAKTRAEFDKGLRLVKP